VEPEAYRRADVLRLKVLGGLSIHRDGKALSGALAQPRRLAVFALLARAGPGGVSRDRIVATLWPDIEEERARHTFSQTIYAIRREVGDDGVIEGIRELRLNTELLSVDVLDFQSALTERDLQRAADMYGGPFLDGFHLPGAEEFERWAERERASLDRSYTTLLEQLARDATARDDHTQAVHWWRVRAARDPLEARVALSLMQALDAAGDRLGAIQHARVYELLVDEELSLPPDREVVRYAATLRREQVAAAAAESVEAAAAPAAVVELPIPAPSLTQPEIAPPGPASPPEPPPRPVDATGATLGGATVRPRSLKIPTADFEVDWPPSPKPPAFRVASRASQPLYRRHARWLVPLTAALVVVAALGAVMLRSRRTATGRPAPVVAVGRITDYRKSESAAIAGPLTDLLATNLGRAPGVRVVSTARMYDLLRRIGNGRDSTSGAFAEVATQAGAEELVDGALYDHDGKLRLDVRRIDLATGSVRAAYSVEAADIFSLADSGTSRIISGLGVSPPPGSVADVTTRSATAYRMYEQGLRAHYRGDITVARNFFEAAVAEDSLFALAEYYAAVDAPDVVQSRRRLERARQLAARATDRERLTILAGWAGTMALPSLHAIAETLAVRYPTEVAGHLDLGIALVHEGRFLEALGPLERVVAMDSLGLHNAAAACGACEALHWIVSAYGLADSLAAAERVARRWFRLQPDSRNAVEALTDVLDIQGRGVEADSVLRSIGPGVMQRAATLNRRASYLIRAGEFETADRLLGDVLQTGDVGERIDAYWTLAISLRQQGRLADALEAAHRLRAIIPKNAALIPASAPTLAALEAQILLEIGRPRASAALFDSIARGREELESGPTAARRMAWNLTHSATARAAAGDTAALGRLVDSVQSLGATSGLGRDVRLHHYVRGLLLVARHDDQGAVRELQQAMLSPTFGYTRASYELARALTRVGRPAEAVAVVQPALRGSIESSNLYVTRTELHELLAQAWDAANGRDSAAVNYRVVANAWRRADPPLQARRAQAEARAEVIVGRR
jgi:DNA-binding SARP family transcriptional activator/tetratricopeptide (TPR) repeat protein